MFDKTFDPKTIEAALSKQWVENAIGKPSGSGEAFCIMVPPPNVTGSLHLGHALQHAIMDTLARQKRLENYNVLLQVGTDHAGIATQMVVEQQLKKEGLSKQDLGREEFLKKVWEWKAQSGGTIQEQMKKIGLSVDWETDRFTMDTDFSNTVSDVFITLHEQGYIYKGKRLVHWDTVLKTAISDLEVQSVSRQGSIWYIKYPIEDEYITVATTRPETLLGDSAICVHPEDTRYQHLIGKMATVPLCNRKIPVIADENADPEFGTGCVKITPAHDFNDFEVGKRHNLEMINVLDQDGKLNENTPKDYQGLDRFEARKKIIIALKDQGLLEKTESHTSVLPIGDRSQTILEPYLTDQWYIKMQDLAKEALSALHDEKLQFIPKSYGKIYQSWLDNIEDWCISRQLWWGHRIPAFYDENGNVYVGKTEEAVREKHNIQGTLTQDDDVLDTWFSSALWPFVTLNWPQESDRLETFYPNSLLVTGFDIIFFWVARMCMFGQHLTKTMPFPKVYITGLIRDEFGQKMSKSKGNVLDPIDLIEGTSLETLLEKRTKNMMIESVKASVIKATNKSFPNGIEPHGTDALRFTLLQLCTHSKDINFDLNKLRASRNFCNKIWNAARFLSQSDSTKIVPSIFNDALNYQLNILMQDLQKHLNDYRFDLYAKAIYDFFWHEFCDWHLELSKIDSELSSTEKMGHLYQTFDQILILLHPALPFITEALWQVKFGEDHSITQQTLPKISQGDQSAYLTYQSLQSLISGIRNIRSELNINPKENLSLYYTKDNNSLLSQFETEVKKLAGIDNVEKIDSLPNNCCVFLTDDIEIGISLLDKINPQEEKQRLEKKLKKLTTQYEKLNQKVSNPNYQEKAPDDLKQKDQALLSELEQESKRLESFILTLTRL